MPEQDSNLSNYRRPICIHRHAERCGSFIQHVSTQAKGANEKISTVKKKERKVISLLKVSLESKTKIKPSAEGSNFQHLKGNSNNVDKHNFNAAFLIACAIKFYNASHTED